MAKRAKKKARKPSETWLPRGAKSTAEFKSLKATFRKLAGPAGDPHGLGTAFVTIKVPIRVFWDDVDVEAQPAIPPIELWELVEGKAMSSEAVKKWQRKVDAFHRRVNKFASKLEVRPVDVWLEL